VPDPSASRRRALIGLLAAALLAAGAALTFEAKPPRIAAEPVPPLPERLSETGLYVDHARHEVAPGNHPFSPQYPLWTDGAAKRRWIHLPAGTWIDASDPDAWVFPVGTKLWKEFGFERRVETRLIENTAEGWRFATYRWAADQSDAFLAPAEGVRGAHEVRPGVPYDLPGRADCTTCHASGRAPVLGFSALQLSPLRDPLAPNAKAPEPGSLDLALLVERGLVRGLPASVDPRTLRIETASERERAVRGWLHANCASCHNAAGPLASLDLALEARVGERGSASGLASVIERASRFHPRSLAGRPALRVAPGAPESSVLYLRVSSREPSEQMPPLGTRLVDEEARGLLEAWIREDLGRVEAPASPATASLFPKE
jgi:mono/diheme cytochrome c family protein